MGVGGGGRSPGIVINWTDMVCMIVLKFMGIRFFDKGFTELHRSMKYKNFTDKGVYSSAPCLP